MEEQQTSSNAFTDDGRLLQAEYAIKGVGKAGTIAGLACSDGVVLLGINQTESSAAEKIYQLNSSVFCAVAGIFSDALRLVKLARIRSANLWASYGAEPTPGVLCDFVSAEKQRYTQGSGMRPFGVSMLYCGRENGEYVLYSTDPSGTVNRWKAWSFGTDSDAINSSLRGEIPDEPVTLEEGVPLLFKIFGKAREHPPGVAQRTEVLVYRNGVGKALKADEIESIIQKSVSGAE